MTDQKTLEPKDVLLVLPVVATTLAISWQVGRMMPFGGFRFFSLTEHLIAATAALPIALVVTLLAGVMFGALRNGIQPPRRPLRVFGIILLANISMTAVIFYFYGFQRSTIIFDVATLIFVANVFWLKMPLTSITTLLFAFGVALIFTVTFANEKSADLIRAVKSGTTPLSTVISKAGDKTLAYVVMSGEHGLLLYDPPTDLVTYLPSDDVKKVEWPR